MTAAAEPVPTLELPSAALMQWSQLALLLAAQLAARRERLDRLAWSTDEHAARAHGLAELREAIEPAVRAMTTDEIAHWPVSDSNRVPGTAGLVSAEVAPISDRWALHATAHHDDTTVGQVWVSCRDETLARELAREIVASGQPETVYRSVSGVPGQRGWAMTIGKHGRQAVHAGIRWAAGAAPGWDHRRVDSRGAPGQR
jgi:hypothetical protein